MWAARFDAFARRKEQQARDADVGGVETADDRSSFFQLGSLGTRWTRERFDGPFYWTPGRDGRSVNLVIVRSRDGNTGADDPTALGGGDTDKHLIYEGLTRVHAHAVLAGSRTAVSSGVVFSVWHPEIVRLRAALGLPRHPVQIVVSSARDLRMDDELIFNVPAIPAVLVTTDEGAARCEAAAAVRPWVRLLPTGGSIDLGSALDRLFADSDIRIVSAVGGRTTARALIEAGLVSDLYLTTTARPGGEPGTALDAHRLARAELVIRKSDRHREPGIVFEHYRL